MGDKKKKKKGKRDVDSEKGWRRNFADLFSPFFCWQNCDCIFRESCFCWAVVISFWFWIPRWGTKSQKRTHNSFESCYEFLRLQNRCLRVIFWTSHPCPSESVLRYSRKRMSKWSGLQVPCSRKSDEQAWWTATGISWTTVVWYFSLVDS